MRTRHALALLATATVLAAPVAAQAAPYQHTPQPVARGTGGAATTVDKTATDAAIRVLRRGGNAVDAAVAAAARPRRGRQRGARRRGPRPPSSASWSPSRAGSAAAGSWSSASRTGA